MNTVWIVYCYNIYKSKTQVFIVYNVHFLSSNYSHAFPFLACPLVFVCLEIVATTTITKKRSNHFFSYVVVFGTALRLVLFLPSLLRWFFIVMFSVQHFLYNFFFVCSSFRLNKYGIHCASKHSWLIPLHMCLLSTCRVLHETSVKVFFLSTESEVGISSIKNCHLKALN